MVEKFQQLNYSAIARDTGISVSHVHLILNGKRNPTLPVARKVAKSIGVTLDQLVMHMDRRQAAAA